ncbi:MAG TPA: LysR family transcriptional regulator [Kofleriaceae bacterium]|nr:LysR family transcriptional regulator [Kofleriaceae bacterium]
MHRPSVGAERLHWDDVRLFLALCRSPTVGAAARALGVDGSTVSRRLAALEAELQAALFDRGRDGIAATKAAEDLMPVAEEIEAVVQRFAAAAAGLEREVAGLVRITCPPDVAEVIVAPVLRELRARHPELRFHIAAGEAVLDLARREADLALRTVRPVSGDLLVTRLATVRWVVAAAPAVAAELGALRRWTAAPWIGWSERFAHVGPARWHTEHVASDPAVRSDSLAVQLSAVKAGLGVALVPEPSVAHYGLAPVALAPRLRAAAAACPVDDLFLVTHRALRDVPRVRAVWDGLVARLAGSRGGAMSSTRHRP